jgi:hypothetical protein
MVMKIRCQNSRAGAKFFISCVLFLALCSYYMLASAQENEVEVIVEDKDSSEKAVNVIVISEDPSDADDSEQMETDADGSERRDVDVNRRERNARMRQAQRFQQGERARQRPGEMFPPEARKIMEEENISPQDLRDPEIRRKLREKVELMRKESEEDSPPEEASQEEPRGRPERPGRSRQGGSSADEGLNRYMDTIVKNSLFLPLGSGGEVRRSSYSLTAVISNTSDESNDNDKAIIEERGGGKSYYVSEGDTFADEIKVEEIDEEVVKLDRSGDKEELRLGEGTGGGGRRGGGGGRRPGGAPGGERRPGEANRQEGGSNRGGQENFDPDSIPPFARRMLEERGISIDELRNNPDLRESLRREFEQRFRGGGERRQFRGSERVSPNRVRRR